MELNMSLASSNPIQYRLYGTDISNGVLEVNLRYLERTISVSPVARHPPRIVHESPPTPFHNALFYLSLHKLQDPLFYIRQFLSSLSILPTACEVISRQIASYFVNSGSNFHIIAEIDFVLVIWMEAEQSIADKAPPLRRGVAEAAVERVKSEEKGEELGDCSVCLDELSCEKREVIRIPCGHAYHKSCIFSWLRNYNSCPLCRKPLPLEDPK